MPRRARRTHNPAFKAKVALDAIKGAKTLADLAQQYDCSPQPDHGVAVSGAWRRRLWTLSGCAPRSAS
jgi:transposase-like protein